jgi:hypothetical protein
MPSELCHTLALLGVARVVVGELLRSMHLGLPVVGPWTWTGGTYLSCSVSRDSEG